jgi:hypothetical protein
VLPSTVPPGNERPAINVGSSDHVLLVGSKLSTSFIPVNGGAPLPPPIEYSLPL